MCVCVCVWGGGGGGESPLSMKPCHSIHNLVVVLEPFAVTLLILLS